MRSRRKFRSNTKRKPLTTVAHGLSTVQTHKHTHTHLHRWEYVRAHRSATQPLSVIYGPHLDNGPWILCVCMGNKCPMNHVGLRRYKRGGGGIHLNCKTTILTFTDHNNLNLNLPFRKWDHFGRGYAMPQGINLDMCRLCPSDCYFTSKHFKWQREADRQWHREREGIGKEAEIAPDSHSSCPRCVALIKTPVIFVQMEMKMKININMGAGECH